MRQHFALAVAVLLCTQAVLPALAFPQGEGRKFAAKPNAHKKVAAVTQANEVTEPVDNGFSFGNILGTMVQMFLSGGNDKSDSVGGIQSLMGTVLAGLLGGQDKDMAALAKQAGNIIQIITSLLDALKVSFSQRSSYARSLGAKDPFSDAAIAAVVIMKGYINTHKTTDDICMQKIMCETNQECARDAPDSGYLFCQIGTYASSYLLEKSTFTPLDAFTHAGKKGRTGESCAEAYKQCNEL